MSSKTGYIYIVTNRRRTVLYVGVTSDLVRRIAEHQSGTGAAFPARYQCTVLVYWEECADIGAAIEREKALKGSSRQRKISLIEAINPEWRDLAGDLDG